MGKKHRNPHEYAELNLMSTRPDSRVGMKAKKEQKQANKAAYHAEFGSKRPNKSKAVFTVAAPK